MDQIQRLQTNFKEIEADWPDASLDEKEGYVTELETLEQEVTSIQDVEGIKLLHDIRYLRGHITEKIIPAQQRRNIDLRRSQQIAGGGL